MTFGLYFIKHNYGKDLFIIKILNIEILNNIK